MCKNKTNDDTIKNPRHLKHQNIIERVRVVLLHTTNKELYELHVHVLQACTLAVKHHGYLFTLFPPVQSLQEINEELLHVLHLLHALEMLSNTEHEQLPAVLIPVVTE